MTTFTLARETKGGYFRYEHQGRSIYCPKTLFTAEPPATISITADGVAEPKVAKETDPVALQAKATKAAERAQRAADQAKKLAEQVERLKAQQPAPQAETITPRGKSKKAVAA